MNFVTFYQGEEKKLGILKDEAIVDIGQVANRLNHSVPQSLDACINSDESAMDAIGKLLESATNEEMLAANDVNLAPPVSNPEKILCVGLNYRQHANEMNSPIPEIPVVFSKFSNALSAHEETVSIPEITDKVDHEVELAIIIGETAKSVSVERALEHVFGYTIANDLSARDLQKRTSQWVLGKSCDGFCPIGPSVVTTDEIPDPQTLSLQTVVNGEVKQSSTTADMIFSCAEIISHISHHMTLKPGDIILTGTPEGVIMGEPEETREFLKQGDRIDLHIDQLGTLTTHLR
ncbi:fumarylacetoacetate hydrolase family protein [Texcoconibacillus texcoconensis]|uniref:2-keto-4-pentenoate hydratase/2-oxohepta-3-ene-1,7-dioic acid hydratase in catechol pathway n=1 Tax=Texcoconibacillus texcoconensis TaxID=1095777 RepID=A0A840QSI6_9BACI|nr:fumarylacetoacetate hydrolase family protein [Texcoconibacillus texcoconensis]MBB5174278.1 2-keto-4-pentenoate hydratase/2-oxohepta-3-ene-1,7-dioic acid hydratase in catechol pathway [Texcoconibacillus texcoconensis]